MKGKEGIREENLQVLKNLSYIELRLDYQPLFGKMSQDSSPRKSSLWGGSKTVPGRQRKSSLYRAIKKQNTKKKTSPKGKQKKRKEKQVLPGIKLWNSYVPGYFITTMPCETHCEGIDNVLLKAFPLGLLPARPV